jgi:hypothetical protein
LKKYNIEISILAFYTLFYTRFTMPKIVGKGKYKCRSDGKVELQMAKNRKELRLRKAAGKLPEHLFVARVVELPKNKKTGAHCVFRVSLSGSDVGKASHPAKCIQFAALAKTLRVGDLLLVEPEGDGVYMIHFTIVDEAELQEAVSFGASCGEDMFRDGVFDDGFEVQAADASGDEEEEDQVDMDDL